MTHRGTNSVSGTVQIFDGLKWVGLLALRFAESLASTASTLWHESTGSTIGYTGANNMREQLTHSLDNQSTATGLLSEEKRVVLLDAPSEVQIPYDFPLAVNGIVPQEGVVDGENRLVVELTISVVRNDGSSFAVSKFLATWRWDSDATGYAPIGVQLLTDTAGTFDIDADDDGGTPALARLLIGQAGSASALRYFIDMDIKLFKYVP